MIEARLGEIRGSEDVGQLVQAAWEEHHGIMCAGVNWDRQGESPASSAGPKLIQIQECMHFAVCADLKALICLSLLDACYFPVICT